jgi:hypothetical protein
MSKSVWNDTSGTSCVLKWTWSTVQLYRSVTKSCFHNPDLPLTPETFSQFHNLERKVQDRQEMLQGQWPAGCEYCRHAEAHGATSDRITHNQLPGLVPKEVLVDSTALTPTPKIVEIYFNNVCNFSCVYCNSSLSSRWADEVRRHGEFDQSGVTMLKFDDYDRDHYQRMLTEFWSWLSDNHSDLHRMNVLGGEPLLLQETQQLLDFFDQHPSPQMELSFVTNLGCPNSLLVGYIDQWERLVQQRKLKRVDIMASIDNWGPQAEFMRHGLDLELWERNMKSLLTTTSAVYLGINIAVNCLGLHTLPDLIQRWCAWNLVKPVNLYSSRIFDPSYFAPEVLPYHLNQASLTRALDMIPTSTWATKWGKERLAGAVPLLEASPDGNPEEIKKLLILLDEVSRRRSQDWRAVFPWLAEWVDHEL